MVNKIYEACRILLDNHDYVLTNVYMFKWESDIFAISKSSGYAVEIEVKVSRSDYLADFKKPKHNLLKAKIYINELPNRFYFACPENLISKEEVPEYAGLIYVKEQYGGFYIEKKAPLIHRSKNVFETRLLSKYYNTSLNTRNRLNDLLYYVGSHLDDSKLEEKIRSIIRLLK